VFDAYSGACQRLSERRILDALPETEAVFKRRLRAEHNHWWTERLLAWWVPCVKPAGKAETAALKETFHHWDIVPFEQLDNFTKDLDGGPAVAMVALGFKETSCA
jgi:hypothetical protein